MGFLSDHLRPNRAQRHRVSVAQDQRALLTHQAERARIAARIHKDNEIAQIKAAVVAFKAEIEAWYQSELAIAMQRYTEEETDYQNLVQDVRAAHKAQDANSLQSSDYSNDAEFLAQCQQIVGQLDSNPRNETIITENQDSQQLATITQEFEQKIVVVNTMFVQILQQIEKQWLDYQNTYELYIAKLTASRDEQLSTINSYELQEISKAEAAYQQHLAAINQELRKGLEEIDNTLMAQLKQLKHAARVFVITALTAVVAAVATYFTAGMLAGLSAYLIDMVQTTLALTGLRATERLVNGSDSFSIDASINVAPQPTSTKFTPAIIHDKELQPFTDISFDYHAFQRRFEEFGQNVHIDANNDVFHQGSKVNVQGNEYKQSKPININPITKSKDLDESAGKSLLIGSGRLFVETGQGIKELSLQCGKKLGIVEPAVVTNYGQAIKKEHDLYHSTPVANSIAGKAGEFAAGALVYSFVPVGAGLRGYKLAAAGAASGGFISGMQPVYDGAWETRSKNVAVGASIGAVAAPAFGMLYDPAKKAIVKLYDAKLANKSLTMQTYSPLDWSISSPRTRSNAAHHVLTNHGKINLQKPKQDVFYSDPISISEKAWFYIQKNGLKPVQYNGTDIYIIQRGNIGFASGMRGQRQNLDYITIITQSKTNKIITAFPSGRTPPLPNDYVFNFEINKLPRP